MTASAELEGLIVPAPGRSTVVKWLLLVLLLLPLLVPLFRQYWIRSHEGTGYAMRVLELRRCWDDGMLSARWFPDLYYNQGYPFLCFYAPLTIVVAGLLTLAGAGVFLSLKLTVTLAVLLAALGVYRLLRRTLSLQAAAVGSILYVYSPYEVLDLYTRGDLSELMAMGILPWCVDGVLALRLDPSLRCVIGVGIAGAAIILSHNVLGLIAGGVMLVAAIVAGATSSRPLRTAWAAVGGGALALFLSCFFWIPALAERRWVQVEKMVEGYYSIDRNFLSVASLVGLGKGQPEGPEAAVVIGLGWHVLLLAFVAIVAMRRLPRDTRPLWLVAVALLVGGVFFMNSASKVVYDLLPLLRFVQFPWRFAALAALGAAILAAAGFEILARRLSPRLRTAAAALVALVAIALVWKEIAPLPSIAETNKSYLPATLRERVGTATALGEFMPIWVSGPHVPTGFENGVKVIGDATVADVIRRVGRYELRVEAREPATLVLLDLYYPGWKGTLDGRSVELRPRAETGNIELRVPAGRGTVRVWLGLTSLRAITAALSGVTAAVVALLLMKSRSSAST